MGLFGVPKKWEKQMTKLDSKSDYYHKWYNTAFCKENELNMDASL